MKLKRPNLRDPKTVSLILTEIRVRVPEGDHVTIRQLRYLLFDSVQLTTRELVQFVKVHGYLVFDKCERPSQFRENYQTKSQTHNTGVGQHGN